MKLLRSLLRMLGRGAEFAVMATVLLILGALAFNSRQVYQLKAEASEQRVRGTPARFEGELKLKENTNTSSRTVAANYGYFQMGADGTKAFIWDDEEVVRELTSGRVIFQGLTASAAHIGTTTAETALTPATSEGDDTLKVDDMATGAVFDVMVALRYTSDSTGAETLRIKGYLGGTSGTALFDTTAFNAFGTSVTDSPIIIRGRLIIRDGDATGGGLFEGQINYKVGTATAVTLPICTVFSSVDLTATKDFTVSADWGGTTAAPDTLTLEDISIIAANYD